MCRWVCVRSEVPGLQTLITLFMATIFAVVYSSYVGEYSRRRLMILLYRMCARTQRTPALCASARAS